MATGARSRPCRPEDRRAHGFHGCSERSFRKPSGHARVGMSSTRRVNLRPNRYRNSCPAGWPGLSTGPDRTVPDAPGSPRRVIVRYWQLPLLEQETCPAGSGVQARVPQVLCPHAPDHFEHHQACPPRFSHARSPLRMLPWFDRTQRRAPAVRAFALKTFAGRSSRPALPDRPLAMQQQSRRRCLLL